MQKQEEEKKPVKKVDEEVLNVIDICEKVFIQYNEQEMEDNKGKIKKARGGNKIPVFGLLVPDDWKGISFEDLEHMMGMVSALPKEHKTKKDVQNIISVFPDRVVEEYADKLAKRKKALKTLKEQYKKADENFRREFYEQLRKATAWGRGSWLEGTLSRDTELKLEDGQESMRYPVLDFYRLLLLSYDAKNPPDVFGATGITEAFLRTVDDFVTVCHNLAIKSNSFKDFDAKVKGMKSFEIPVVK